MDLTSLSLQSRHMYQNELVFNKETWCIQEMYWYHLYLNKYKTKNSHKVIVIADDQISDENKVEYMANVTTVKKTFDFQAYFQLSRKDKKKALLEILHTSMLIAAKHQAWEVSPLQNAYNYCLEKNLTNEWLLKNKYVRSPNRQHYGGILAHWDVDKFEAFVIILDKNKIEIERKKIITLEPHLAAFIYWGMPKWKNHQEFELVVKPGTWGMPEGKVWNVEIPR